MRYLFALIALHFIVAAAAQPADTLFQPRDLTAEMVFSRSVEGPAAGPDGIIYLVNFGRKGTIGQIDQYGRASLFVELPSGSTGNGIRFSSYGDMFIADYTGHNILTIKKGQKRVATFAHEPRMNQPNDIAISKRNILFASDPCWKDSTGSLWKIDTSGKVTLLESNMGTTNGVEVSPNNRYLYVNESIQRRIWRYDLDRDGNVSNKTLFFSFPDFGMDGMRCDAKGNLYVTRHGKGTVVVLSPKGKIVREIRMKGKLPSNIAFGGSDGKTCFVTMQDRGCVEVFRNDIKGREY
jgi:sugar lactone lactonase YvrE